jgi:hypothetical protein
MFCSTEEGSAPVRRYIYMNAMNEMATICNNTARSKKKQEEEEEERERGVSSERVVSLSLQQPASRAFSSSLLSPSSKAKAHKSCSLFLLLSLSLALSLSLIINH